MTKRRPLSEQEWLTAESPYLLIQHLHQHLNISRVPGGQRRLRLFRCACCRAVWDLFDDDLCRQAVELSERYADRAASRAQLKAVHDGVEELAQAARQQMGEASRHYAATDGVWKTTFVWQEITSAAQWTASTRFDPRVTHIVTMSTQLARAWLAGESPASSEAANVRQQQERMQTQLLQDIFGNPFHSVTVDPSWLTPTVKNLATASYEQRSSPGGELDATSLAVLADALEEAGCADQAILGHLRGPGPHVRGCHILDEILRRS
jgi:hypothetical protein